MKIIPSFKAVLFKLFTHPKKITIILLIGLLFIPFNAVRVMGEDYSDRDAWDAKCAGVVNEECDAYRAYVLEEKRELINNLEDLLDNLEGQLEQSNEVLAEAQTQIAALDVQIKSLEEEIKVLEEKITLLETEINENEVKVEDLNQRVLYRMTEAQKTMHFNPYLDFLLGATDFEDLMRRSYGLEAIMSKDKEDRDTLIDIITKLENDKSELDKSYQELDAKRKDLEESQAYFYELQETYQAISIEITAEMEETQNELDSLRRSYSDVLSQIGDISNIPSSAGLYSPAPGASINEGTWYYSGGGVHLGVDYGLPAGATLYAPANGVVILSADGCPSTGYLGNGCGANIGGVYAGGNQVIMIVSAMDTVYGVSFFHMQQGSPTGTGVISEGDYVGRVGSSGNSTGPHCHIELYYLGEGDMSDIQDDYLYRDYTLGFNCGWGAYGLNRLCENGVGAPCRLRPELYFGR